MLNTKQKDAPTNGKLTVSDGDNNGDCGYGGPFMKTTWLEVRSELWSVYEKTKLLVGESPKYTPSNTYFKLS